MKQKGLAWLMAGLMAMNIAVVPIYAEDEDYGVKLISEDDEEDEVSTLDDIVLEETIEIEDFAEFYPEDFITNDKVNAIGESGSTADYAILRIKLLNLQTKSVDFNTLLSDVQVTYKDKYKYEGWVKQRNPETGRTMTTSYQYPIDPMYEGYYAIGCTLPNAVIEGTESLVMTFKLGDYDVTYNIR